MNCAYEKYIYRQANSLKIEMEIILIQSFEHIAF